MAEDGSGWRGLEDFNMRRFATLFVIATALASLVSPTLWSLERVRANQPVERKVTHAPMPADAFWKIIEEAGRSRATPKAHEKSLAVQLRKLSQNDLIAFEVAFRTYLNNAYSWDLWGAAYIIHGGASDDGFEYFRRWLVAQGRAVYEAALANPDSLADAKVTAGPEGLWEFEEIYYVAGTVFKTSGGAGDIRDFSPMESGLGGPGPSGEKFEDDPGYFAKRYPKLWKRFGENPLP
jgi:hypothetical protein